MKKKYLVEFTHLSGEVEKVELMNKSGVVLGYSKYKYSLEAANKKGVIYPSLDPSIFELKYPDSDIRGRVITY